MLPRSYCQIYENFLNLLLEFQELVINTQSNEEKLVFKQLQQFFSEQILPLTDEGLEPDIALRWRSLQTELYRTWRLMETDWLFLASARQMETKQARLSSFRSRIDRTIGYCRILLQE